jgi:hypothetical protein
MWEAQPHVSGSQAGIGANSPVPAFFVGLGELAPGVETQAARWTGSSDLSSGGTNEPAMQTLGPVGRASTRSGSLA